MLSKSALSVLGLFCSLTAFAAQETYTFDPAHTYPYFAINHLGFSTMYGRFNKTSGRLIVDKEAKLAALDLVIDAGSIDTGHQKRDEHLRSPDFFNVSEFPFITFKSLSAKFEGDVATSVDGELTLHGVTKPVTVAIEFMRCADHPMDKGKFVCGFGASAQINRSDFGMKYGLPAIGDEVRLIFEVEAQRN